MKWLELLSLNIIIILVMLVLYLHTNAIKEQIKYKFFNLTTLIYDVFVYVIGIVIIGFCVYYMYSI